MDKQMTASRRARLFLSPPHMSGEELKLVKQAFASNYVAPLGPMVDAFEKEFADYTGMAHCLAVTSGTAAIHLALRCLGLGPGDEVIASTLTFVAGVSPVTFLGATPVFVDSDRETWNMDPRLLAEEIAECVKRGRAPGAVVPTDLYGRCCDLPRILEICKPYGIPVVCDSAEAVGARFRNVDRSSELRTTHHAGYGARAAVYSFNGNKIITTSGGGMLASESRDLIDHARKLATQARDPAPHYEHSEIGYNYRMSNIAAAIGRGQLRVLDERVKRRREIFARYRELLGELPGIEFAPEGPYSVSNRWLTVVLITPDEFGAKPEEVRLALERENIEARPVWKPMHLQPVFKACRFRSAQRGTEHGRPAAKHRAAAVSEDLFGRGLCLPSGTAMTDSDVEKVAAAIGRCRT